MRKVVPKDEPAFVRVHVYGLDKVVCPNCNTEPVSDKHNEEAEPTFRKTPLSITCEHCFCTPKLDPIINGKMVVMCCKCALHKVASVHMDDV